MDYDVLPGPSLAELARTTMLRATAATVSYQYTPDARLVPAAPVPLRTDARGVPVLMPRAGSALARRLSAEAVVTIAVPADTPFSSLRITGSVRPLGAQAGKAALPGAPAGFGAGFDDALAEYEMTPRSLEFTGAAPVRVAITDYQTARPDPFWHDADLILRHLEDAHMTELVECVRAHGLAEAEVVVPEALDRFGLRLLVLASTGVADVRLAFPDGPVSSLREVPVSIQAMLTCRCGDS
ncbi:MAG TPA: DUF2470 domain-containing protein [Trebonia sp.]|jgi:hypothetical protein